MGRSFASSQDFRDTSKVSPEKRDDSKIATGIFDLLDLGRKVAGRVCIREAVRFLMKFGFFQKNTRFVSFGLEWNGRRDVIYLSISADVEDFSNSFPVGTRYFRFQAVLPEYNLCRISLEHEIFSYFTDLLKHINYYLRV
jgi:hypothetical protein